MTSATEVLRRLLDERDEYYKTSGNKTWWGRPIDRQTGKPINVFHYQAQPMGEDRLFVELQLATPEQAIAATLGAGTLTAEQVMAIAGRHQPDYCSDTHACFDWQAIADELNDTLGPCNCTNDCTNSERTETCADGGTVSETYIRPAEEGSICPMPRASVIFEGQKLTFDEEDSARFTEIVKRHLRKLAGLEVEQ